MDLTKMFELQRQHDAALIEKNGLTGDLLSRKVLALQVAVGKVAELAGVGQWHTTKEARTAGAIIKISLILADAAYCKKCGDAWDIEVERCPTCDHGEFIPIKYTNPLLEAYTEALSLILSIGMTIGYECVELNARYPITFRTAEEILLHLFHDAFHLDKEQQMGIFEYEYFIVGYFELGVELGFTEEQIETAYLESIERQRAAIG
ncbi:hypothetical protein [Tumebacillus permanentifrigoris]|uniref:Dimeric dUTPase (All-alpha-NTP-PPase superfamily) n=1 Tax=Tumebacillus permanentifrigoris TaxID=378543 RepID=A0A316D307_9BACL|nr:hypothetical protein [Tumebacillus permanentifrigoris]PWK05327.1 dimeric dUTPase (all-alpha-NTP-PPase superfamily) [Tumebacillus permanentifrigoris]